MFFRRKKSGHEPNAGHAGPIKGPSRNPVVELFRAEGECGRRSFMAALSGLVASFYAGGMPEDAIVCAGEEFFEELGDEESSVSSEESSVSSESSEVSSCSCAGACCVGFDSGSVNRKNCPDFKGGCFSWRRGSLIP